MLAAHVSSVGQVQYDAQRDYVITQGAAGEVILPLSYDAQEAFRLLQVNLNRIRRELNLAPIAVDSVIDARLLNAVVEVAGNPSNITAVTQPTMIDLKTDTTYQNYVLLAPFRKVTDATRAATLEDLAIKARLWATVFGGIADNTWLGSQEIQTGVVTFDPKATKSVKLPVVLATVGGIALGGLVGVLVWRRTH